MIARMFDTSLAMLKVVGDPARVISICLPTRDDLDELGWIRVQVGHGLPASLAACSAGVHGHRGVAWARAEGRRSVPSPVMATRAAPFLQLIADQECRALASRRGFGQEIVYARLGGDGRGRHRVVAGNHHGFDSHAALGKPFAGHHL